MKLHLRMAHALGLLVGRFIPPSTARAVVRLQLFARLWLVARRRKLGVAWSTTPLKGRRRLGKNPLGIYVFKERLILLGPGSFFDPWTLAHEIGHDMATRALGESHPEAEADHRGRILVLKLLTSTERALLAKEMDWELPKRPLASARRRRK